MKIALISKLWEETSPQSVGGTGAVVGILADELVKRGHDVTLFATGNSKTKAKLVFIREYPWGEGYSEEEDKEHISQAFKIEGEFDVINCFVEEKACEFAAHAETPTIINVTYGEIGAHERSVFEKNKNLNYVSPSKAITKLLPSLHWIDVLPHGINTDLFSFNESPKDYLLFLGRLSPQKGPDIAIRVAQKTGKKLILAGKIVERDKEYLEKSVLPFIDNKQIVYMGVADFNKKRELLRNASALLHPTTYFEAFGMTLIEAMACGTPVISFDNGAPKEIIETEKTGFIVASEDEMSATISKISSIFRMNCRSRVENEFSASKMAGAYERLFNKLALG